MRLIRPTNRGFIRMPREPAASPYSKTIFIWESKLWIVLILWLGFALIDIERRFIVAKDTDYLITPQSIPALEPLSQLTKGQYDAYLERLGTARGNAEPDPELIVDGFPSDFFAKPEDSVSWDYGGFGYRLLGVFFGEEQFVLVASQNGTDGKEVVMRLQKDSVFDGHKVFAIFPKSLVLVANDGAKVTLSLFEKQGGG